MPFPSYAIAIIIILVIVCISTSVYFILRKRRRGGSVDAVREHNEEYITEKNTTSPYAVKPLIGYNNNIDTTSTIKDGISSSSTIPPTTTTIGKSKEMYENKSMEDSSSSVWTANDNGTPLSPSADVKITLPLPPPNASFFSDKMELDSTEANELYTSYMNVAAQQEYVSIDLDEKPFLSNAAANIQQKAATLRSTLRQSMRRKSSSTVPKVSLNQFFDNASSTTNGSSLKSPRPESTRMSRQSSSTSSRFPTRSSLQQPAIPPSPRPDSPASEFFGKFGNNSRKSLVIPDEMNSSNKLMLENVPPESYFSLPMTPTTSSPTPPPLTMKPTIQQQQELAQQQQQEYIMQRQQALVQKQQEEYSSIVSEINNNDLPSVASSSDEAEDEEEPDKDDVPSSQQDAAAAARKLIRSASRKSRTRSMLVSEEAAQNMLALIANATPSPHTSNIDNLTSSSTVNSPKKFGTLRKHNMEIDTNSIRRSSNANNTSDMDIRNWSNNNDSPISPSPKRAIMSSTLSGSATVSGKKMARQQMLASSFNNSSDDLYSNRNTESVTLGRKSGGEKKDGTTSLRNLFTRPDDNKVAPMVIAKEEPTKKKEQLTIAATAAAVESADDSYSMNTPSSPIIPDSPSSSKNNTLRKMGSNVDTIRRMLQSSWSGNNLKESGSSSSLSSSDYMGSVGSSYRPIASPLGSVNPRLQNQHLVSLSLKASAVQQRSRPSMPIDFMNNGEGPIPTASFSSSTVRTMIPADEEEPERLKPKSVVSNLLGSRQPRQPSKLGDHGRSNNNKKTAAGKKTPAQIERERYLKSVGT